MGKSAIGILVVAIAAWVGTIVAFYIGYDRLPERVPVHFDIHGVADGWTTRNQLLPFWLIVPGFCTFLVGIGLILPWVAPSLVGREGVRGKYEFVLLLAALLMGMVQTMVVTSSFGIRFDFGRVVLALVFAFFGLIGYAMRGLKRNPVMGIRLPWTLRSDAIWDETHRAAARMYMGVGAIGAACAIAGLLSSGPGIIVAIVSLFLFAAIVPITYSVIVARRIERKAA
jgi:uncharacterized membrane protein